LHPSLIKQKMKKLLFGALISSLAFNSYAQNTQDTEPGIVKNTLQNWKGWTINPFLFLGGASSSIDIPDIAETNELGGSAVIGCLVGYNLNAHISFNTGIAFSSYIWQKDLGLQAYGVDYLRSTNSFLQIPVLVKATTSKYRRVGFMVEAGFNMNFLTEIEDELAYTYTGSEKSSDDSYNTKFCPTFNIMFGLRIPVSKSTWIDAGLDTYAFLADQYTDISGKMSGTGIKIGVQTKLTK
jgi:hypothetical protein